MQWENQCRASDIEKAELHERIRGAQTTIQAQSNKIAGLEGPSESLEHFETRLRTLEKNHKTELEVLQQKLKETEAERDQSQDNFTAMLEAHQKEIADCEAREAELKKDRDYHFDANKKTQDEYEKALNLTTEAQQLATRLQQEAKEDSKHINDMQAQRDEWMGKAQERGDTVKDLEKQLEVVTEERNHWTTKAAHANDRVEHLELKTKKLLDEYEALHREKEQLKVDLDVSTGNHEQLIKEHDKLEEEKEALEQKVADKDKAIEMMVDGTIKISKIADQNGLDRASLSAELDKVNGERKELEAQVKVRTEERDSWQDEAMGWEESHDEIYEELKKVTLELNRYKELEANERLLGELDFKMDTNIDNLKKGVIAACAHPGNC